MVKEDAEGVGMTGSSCKIVDKIAGCVGEKNDFNFVY